MREGGGLLLFLIRCAWRRQYMRHKPAREREAAVIPEVVRRRNSACFAVVVRRRARGSSRAEFYSARVRSQRQKVLLYVIFGAARSERGLVA